MNSNIYLICKCAAFSALLCICSVITIPTSPIPINLATMGLFLIGIMLPAKESFFSVLSFLALGVLGLPVFAGMQGGIGTLLGPTGGYLMGYLPCVLTISLISKNTNLYRKLVAVIIGCIMCYAIGLVWYCHTTSTPPLSALPLCVLPFLPADIVKGTLSIAISQKINGRI